MEWRLIGCAARLIKKKFNFFLYAAVAGYGLLAQQQLILHSPLIDCLVVFFFINWLIELLLGVAKLVKRKLID